MEIHRPAGIFLLETKMGKDRAMTLKQQLGFPNGLIVPTRGLSGGLALFRRSNMMVDYQNMSRSHIDVVLASD